MVSGNQQIQYSIFEISIIGKKLREEEFLLLLLLLLLLLTLSCVATSVLRMRLLHVVAFSKKLRWLA